MICVRCLRDTAKKVADAPDGSGAWEMYYCITCNYSWRNTEPDYITIIEKRDPWAQLSKIENLTSLPSAGPYKTMKERKT